MSSKKIVFLIVFIVLTGGLYVAWHFQIFESRVNVIGNQSMERLLKECQLQESGIKIMLYRGEPGATVSYWYSVTAELTGTKEKQIFYTYSEPDITSIECVNGKLEVLMSKYPKQIFDSREILELIKHPKGLDHGKEISH